MKKSYPDFSDYFCGAGGTGQAAEEAGMEVEIAANHWKLATDTYESNFDRAKVYCADITHSDPRLFKRTTVASFSPECTTYSPGGGNTYKAFKKQMDLFNKRILDPSTERSRMTMWDVVRFSEYHKYEIVVVENVVEAKIKWQLFDVWLSAMHSLGYLHESKYLNSMHFDPTPQSRDRMYIVFWKKGNPKPDLDYRPEAFCSKCNKIVYSYQWWKSQKKKFGKYGRYGQYYYRCGECTGIVEPFYHAALNIIDWTIPGRPIMINGESHLVPNTLRRIEFALDKFGSEHLTVGDSMTFPPPYLIKTDNSKSGEAGSVRSSLNPFRTVTTTDSHGVVFPAPITIENNGQSTAKSVSKAFPCITTESKHGFINPESIKALFSYYNGTDSASKLTDPAGTITTVDRIALVQYKKPILEECTYRTIRPHEVHKAMAFRDGYRVLGNSKEKVKLYGNGVTPPPMKWIFKRCIESLC